MFHLRLLRVAIAAICLTGVSSLMYPQPAQSEPPYPPKPIPGSGERIEFYPDAPVDPNQTSQELTVPQAGQFPQSFGDWEATAFQSWYNNNWEVIFRQDSSVNISNNEEDDTNPDIDQKHSRIAFEYGIGETIDIVVAPYNGSYKINITDSNRWNEIDPTWSPDGSKIAYAENRLSTYNISVMNSDGSNPQRLTSLANNNFSPSWSPDGTQIAWVQSSGASGIIWIMNANGSNPHAISPAIPYLDHLAWSPDGDVIAFDGDLDGDYWNEIGFINADGSGLHIVFNYSSAGYDVFMGNWSTTGTRFTFSLLEYIEFDGKLYLYSTAIGYHDAATSTGYELYLTSGGDMSPDNFSRDILPPLTSVNPLPSYSRSYGFPLSWSGKDQGISGIFQYRIETRKQVDESWYEYGNFYNSNTSISYSLNYCGKLLFRSIGRDNADNWEEDFSNDGDTWTTLFHSQVSGRVFDNRGVSIPNASITVNPAAYEPSISAPSGNFITRFCQAVSTSINTTVAGYGDLLDTTVKVNQDKSYNLYLPPPDNLVVNGEFEQPPISTNWDTVGGFTLNTFAGHTGLNSIRLSKDCSSGQCLSPIETPFTGNTYNASMAVDKDGNTHIVFRKNLYLFRSANGVWSNPEIMGAVVPYEYSTDQPLIAVDSRNTVHVLMKGNDGYVHYYIKPQGGNWTYVDRFPATVVSKILVDQQDTVYILFFIYSNQDTSGFYLARRTVNGNWQPAYKYFPSYGNYSPPSTMTLSSDNNLHLLLRLDDGWVHVSVHPDGTVKTISTQFEWSLCNSADFKEFFVTPDGEILLLLVSDREDICFSRGKIGTLIPQVKVSNIRTYNFSANIDQNGSAHIFAPDRSNNLHHVILAPGHDQPLDNIIGAGYNDIDSWMDEAGNFRLVFGQYSQLNYVQSIPASQDTNLISQIVTVPSDMVNPTLSFLYSTLGNNTGVEVEIQSGDETFTFPQPVSITWKQGWVDLTPWQGQSIHIRFRFALNSGDHPFGDFLLDSVTVGSWATPVITSVSPSWLVNWNGVTITLTGDNFVPGSEITIGELPITPIEYVDQHTIRITLSDAIPIGAHDVWVKNPDGKQSVLVSGLRLGYFTNLPIVRR